MGAQEIASITALIQKSHTVIKYLKDVQEAPKECNELMRELRHMEIHLSTVKIITLLSTAGDPWLMILQQLKDPFKELTGLLSGIEKGLKVTSLWWKRVGPKLQWTFSEESAQEDFRKIEERANGMFFLADMYITLLAQNADRGEFVEALDNLPDSIEGTYQHFLKRVDSQSDQKRNFAYRVFSWVAFAEQRLTILELQHALAVQPGTSKLNMDKIPDFDLISHACIGFVIVDSQGYVRFAYPTTREYFISQKDTLFPGIQERITRTCLTYMPFDIFRSPDVLSLSKSDMLKKYPFLSYASSKWAIHARKCVRDSVEEDILAFLPTQAGIALSFEQTPDSEPEVPRTPAWFAAHYGLLYLLEALVERGVDLQHENVLCIAAHAGQLDTVKLLLSCDDVDVNQANKITYLYDHSIDRNDGANRLGLEDGKASHPTFCTPLIAAASNGYEEIVRVLLESKDMKSMNFLPPGGPTALSAAVFGNHTRVVKLLLSQPGIDTSVRFLDETPLLLARRMWRADIVKMLPE